MAFEADLRFKKAPYPTPGPVPLVFGELDGPLVQAELSLALGAPGFSAEVRRAYEASLALALGDPGFSAGAAVFSGLTFDAELSLALGDPGLSAVVGPPNDATISVSLGDPGVAATVSFDSLTERPVAGASRSEHQRAQAAAGAGAKSAHQLTQRAQAGGANRHTPALALQQPARAGHQAALPARRQAGAVHSAAVPVRTDTTGRHAETLRGIRPRATATHEEAARVTARPRVGSHQERLRHARPALRAVDQAAEPRRAGWAHGSASAAPMRRYRQATHQEAMRPPAGKYRPLPPGSGRVPCYLPSPHLRFTKLPGGPALLFTCSAGGGPAATVSIPVRRVYMVANTLSLTRVADGVQIPARSVAVSLDVDSWTWGFSASASAQALPLLTPGVTGPTELQLDLNGMSFRVLVEGISQRRSFGRTELTIRGRGRNAVLAAPYAAQMSFFNGADQTAAQAATAALLTNGVPSGWGVDWGLDDWLLPSGAWSFQGSPMDAVLTIAQAAGGYVQPHATEATLLVRHRYPVLPRDWSSRVPDIELPADLVSVEDIRWLDKPAYNRVFVAGGQIGGRLGQITLASTAGDLPAAMVVDPLVTDVPALRQRGRAILGEGGRQAMISLRLPALQQLGLVRPGKLLRYVDGGTTRLGLVRSLHIEASHEQAWQTLGVETHV
ncbi:hypothetical protein HNQ51_001709 [Inhella inkyongensis]|uniref:Uncharacterized protein n=1 Tax=Inhella inkyongensis TaxID=392593 RepID=A0A840S264_9BURK|nr:hypothetical protein [Inhella inkyongensis]MBB5204395.1 hypothetical protein [Inhella inkyongensis]